MGSNHHRRQSESSTVNPVRRCSCSVRTSVKGHLQALQDNKFYPHNPALAQNVGAPVWQTLIRAMHLSRNMPGTNHSKKKRGT